MGNADSADKSSMQFAYGNDESKGGGELAFKAPTIGEIATSGIIEDKTDFIFKAKRANVYTEGLTLDPEDPYILEQFEFHEKTAAQADLIRESPNCCNICLNYYVFTLFKTLPPFILQYISRLPS
jgi:hypothetical protein